MKRSYCFLPILYTVAILSFTPYFSAQALDIDEKLTLRFLKVSSTKKTVLINRGGEDGLVVGDHAKFFITAGVVARGVAEKVSPSRSVWSLYRVIDSNEIVEEKVLNLKIATPVKITDDPTKSIKEIPIEGESESLGTENVDGEKTELISESEKSELKDVVPGEGDADLEVASEKQVGKSAKSPSGKKLTKIVVEASASQEKMPTRNYSKTWEVWGTLAVNSLSGTYESGSTTSTDSDAALTSSMGSSVDISAGLEKYFFNSEGFLKNLSITAFIHKRGLQSGNEYKVKNDWFEYGAGASYHFYHSAADLNTLVGFGNVTVGKGSANLELSYLSSTTGETQTDTVDGSNTFFSFGAGTKYVLNNGFGVRANLDYYRSAETFSNDLTRTLSGIRAFFGVSYRF